MKKPFIWKLLFVVGLCPFIAPFLLAHTRMGSWTLIDWFILWSFVYWPTYLVGLILLAVSVYMLKKANRKPHPPSLQRRGICCII